MAIETRDIFNDPSYRFHPALVLDAVFSSRTRKFLRTTIGVVGAFALAVALYFLFSGLDLRTLLAQGFSIHTLNILWPLEGGAKFFFGILLLLFPLWLILWMLEWYHHSYYYHVEGLLERGDTGAQTPYSTPNFETNHIFFHTMDGDLLRSFLASSYGQEIAVRSGLKREDVLAYLTQRTSTKDFRGYSDIGSVFTLRDVGKAIIAYDEDFTNYIFSKGVRPEDIIAASEWVERRQKQYRRKSRTWGRVALGQNRGIGSDLSYGVAYSLERYSTDLTRAVSQGREEFRHLYGTEILEKIETALSRGGNANALLVGGEGSALMDTVIDFAHDMVNGFMHGGFASAHLMLLDWKSLLAGMKTKQEFESRMIRMMNSAIKAKNIIVVIDDYPGFYHSAETLGSDIVSVIDPYAESGQVRFIATSEMGQYHTLLEQNGAFRARFETIVVPELEKSTLTRTLEDAAGTLERGSGITFTYPAIRAIRESAQRYFVDAVMPDTALKIMGELTPIVARRGDHTLTYDDVMNHIQAKTGVPVGTITDAERGKLEHLEDELHLHVIGQEKALEVIANALRRSRAGVRNPNRPIGTFLFLGPTGVGKTEAAKALARVFFGNESAMIRFDMSEFQSEDGLGRLIGAPGTQAGILANQLREHPYSVLLLDEFEKTHPKVLDLFLQIFDEGIFHDAAGKKVNAQNTIMIATSNAGAALIRDAVRQGIPLESVEKQIIDGVIAEGKYKPELLNRFDALVLFHPLTTEDYRQVAVLMVEKLKKRLRGQGIDITINDVLIEALLAKGVDQDFGARPMNRAVQELVEQTIAKKIISGEVKPGTTVVFKREDFPFLS